jgi:hypothetical protein
MSLRLLSHGFAIALQPFLLVESTLQLFGRFVGLQLPQILRTDFPAQLVEATLVVWDPLIDCFLFHLFLHPSLYHSVDLFCLSHHWFLALQTSAWSGDFRFEGECCGFSLQFNFILPPLFLLFRSARLPHFVKNLAASLSNLRS